MELVRREARGLIEKTLHTENETFCVDFFSKTKFCLVLMLNFPLLRKIVEQNAIKVEI